MKILSKPYLFFAAVFSLLLLTYYKSLFSGYLLDDYLVLFGERGMANKTLIELFTTYQETFYRPVGHFLLWVSFQLFGNQPSTFGYHAVNLLLFTAVICLFYKIVVQLSNNKELAFWTACLYAIHPVNGMQINYITTNTVMSAVIMQQASMLLFITMIKEGKKISALSLGFFFLSLLSHEMSSFFLFYILIVASFNFKLNIKQALVLCLPYVAALVLFLLFRMCFHPLSSSNGTFPIAVYLGTYFVAGCELIGWYISKLIFPVDIVFLWTSSLQYKIISLPQGFVLGVKQASPLLICFSFLGCLAVLALVVYLLFFKWKQDIKSVALLIFMAGVVPVFYISFVHYPYTAPLIEPHWFFFSSIGFYMLGATLILWLKRRVDPKVWGVFIFLLLCGYLVSLNENNSKWKDQETYCRYWLSLNKGNMTPFYGLGKALLEQGRYDEAIQYFNDGLSNSHYSNVMILSDLGYAQFLKGDKKAAMESFNSAMAMDHRYSVLYYYLGKYHSAEEKWIDAQNDYSMALKIFPSNKIYQDSLLSVRQHIAIHP